MSTDSAPAQNEASSADENSVLFKWFKMLLENSSLEISEEDLHTCIKSELKMDFESLNQALRLVLPQMFTVYMRNWTGWDFLPDYKAGKFTIDHYFVRFHKYVSYKLNKCAKGDFNASAIELRKDNVDVHRLRCTKDPPENTLDETGNTEAEDCSGGLLSIPSAGKEVYAPYTLVVKCPPQMMSTIVFTNSEDDVILKHHMGKEWKTLTTSQLMNWPNITVTYLSEDLYFIRSHECHYHRYLNFLPHDCQPNRKAIVENIEHACRRLPRACYSYELLEAYCKEFIRKLKLLQHLPPEKFEEIETILHNFLEDVKLMNQNNSIASNTKILFRLSQTSFVRNKKLLKSDSSDKDPTRVGYCEVITPKIELLLKSFKAKQVGAPDIKFESTERMDGYQKMLKETLRHILPKIYYRCNFCAKDFYTLTAKKEVLEHLVKEHKMEQPVRCTQCKKQFDVLNLTSYRWRHRCNYGQE